MSRRGASGRDGEILVEIVAHNRRTTNETIGEKSGRTLRGRLARVMDILQGKRMNKKFEQDTE